MDKHSPSIAYSSVLNDIISTIEGFTAQTTGSYTQVSIQATLNALTSSSHDIGKTVSIKNNSSSVSAHFLFILLK